MAARRAQRLVQHVCGARSGGAGGDLHAPGATTDGRLTSEPTLGESDHASVAARMKGTGMSKLEKLHAKTVLRFRYERKPVKIVYTEDGGGAGGADTCACFAVRLRPAGGVA